ncbi:MAG: molybdopterin-dependent oxidoreductase, partial [Acidobacteriota bacterium]|nr:molybdopterin-dependent oxidoreductase [Acidobacteriota bacterium]
MVSSNGSTTHYRACNLCEAICGLEIAVEEGRIVSIRGDDDDPFSRGHICPKAVALQDIYNDPDRLKRPLRKTASGWEEIGWDEAFDLAAERLRKVQTDHGRDAVAVYLGNPTVHNYGSLFFGPRFLRTLRTRNRFSATSADQLPHHLASYLSFGHALLLPVPDIDHTSFLLMLGANPVVSNGSMMTAPDVRHRLEAIQKRGGQIVVIDPRRTRTARLADRHHFIRPGTDALLLMALLATIFEKGLETPGPLADSMDGLDRLRTRASAFAPERVAEAVGISAEDIRKLAREFAAAESAVCYGRLGVSVQEFGALCQGLVNALNLVTGNLDRSGGAMFTRPAVDVVAASRGGSFGRWKSRVRGLPEFGGELPVAAMAEEMESEGDGQIRALVTSAGNPVLSTPNGRRLESSLENLDFMLSIDFYLNETTRHADLILPPTAALEHDHYDLVFNLLAVRNTTRYSPALFAPEPGTRHDWQIFSELERRLGKRGPRARAERWLSRRLGPRGLLALGLRRGPWGSGFIPGAKGITLGRLEQAEHGLDLGPLTPCLPDRLKTSDKRIDVFPDLLSQDVARLEAKLKGNGRDHNDQSRNSLVLIGRRQVRSNNSWMHNFPRLMRGRDRCTLQMHPTDAERLGMGSDPDARPRVVVRSRAGRVEVSVEVTEAVMPGVVSLPHGWGHHRPGVRLGEAALKPGASLNDLTDEQLVDTVSGNAAFSGVPVEVEPLPP